MAVATAASQHHALSSVLRIPSPLFHSRLTHARASLYLLPLALPSLSLSHSFSFACFPSTGGLSASLAPEPSPVLLSSLSLFRLPAHNAFPISLRRLRFFYFSFSFFRSPFLSPPTSDGERENGGRPSSSSEPSFLSPLLQVISRENGESGRCETIAKYKWIRETLPRERKSERERKRDGYCRHR